MSKLLNETYMRPYLVLKGLLSTQNDGTIVDRRCCGRRPPRVQFWPSGRAPHSDAKAAATRHQVTGKPLAQLLVVNHQRIAIVGAMAGAKWRWNDFGEGRTAIGGERGSRIVGAVAVVSSL